MPLFLEIRRKLKQAQEQRLEKMMLREDLLRHIASLQAQGQIVERDILACDGAISVLQELAKEDESGVQ